MVRTHLALAKFAADAGDDRAQHGDELRSGWGFRVWGLWFRVCGLGFMVLREEACGSMVGRIKMIAESTRLKVP